MVTRYITQGDRYTPLAAQLCRYNTSGLLAAVDLTGLTVKFCMIDSDGTTIVALTTTGVTVNDAENGRVQYEFQSAHAAGTYYAWFITDSAGKIDTYPADGRTFEIIVSAREARS